MIRIKSWPVLRTTSWVLIDVVDRSGDLSIYWLKRLIFTSLMFLPYRRALTGHNVLPDLSVAFWWTVMFCLHLKKKLLKLVLLLKAVLWWRRSTKCVIYLLLFVNNQNRAKHCQICSAIFVYSHNSICFLCFCFEESLRNKISCIYFTISVFVIVLFHCFHVMCA